MEEHKHHHEHEHCECGHHHDHGCSCGCGHDHEHGDNENRTWKIIQIALSVVFMIVGIIFEKQEFNNYVVMGVFLLAYLIVGYEVIWNAIRNLFKGNLFDENFLMALASIFVFICRYLGEDVEYKEAVLIMLLYQIGELLSDIAVDSSHDSVKNLLSMKEVVVHKVVNDETIDIEITDAKVDDIIIVKVGEKIPLDGVIIDGETALDMSSLTGESIPVNKTKNDEILSGSINLTGVITVKVAKTYDNSTVNKILECIENATVSKTQSERFVTRFAKIYTPIVVGLAAIIIVIPFIFKLNVGEWLLKAAVFLVVSCPCAIIISVPLAYFIGIGVASRNGVLMKGSNYLEMLDKMDTILFDKTGTLTKGSLIVKETNIIDLDLLKKVAKIESYSTHPIAKAIAQLFPKLPNYDIKELKEIIGTGIEATINDEHIVISKEAPKGYRQKIKIGSICYVYVNNECKGFICVTDTLKEDSLSAINILHKDGVKTVILSGDSRTNAEEIGRELGIEKVHSNLLPTQKVDILDEYLNNKKGSVGYVGDGVNDAPVIAKSDVGISMGALGSEAAIEVSDIVIMNDSLLSLIRAKEISKKTIRIVKQNIVLVCVVKGLAIILGAFNLLPPELAEFADVGVCLITILNDLRLFRFSK